MNKIKMIIRLLAITIVVVFLQTNIYAQKGDNMKIENNIFTQVDSLLNNGLPKSALQLLADYKMNKRFDTQSQQYLKLSLYEIVIQERLNDQQPDKFYKQISTQVQNATGINKAFWQYYLAKNLQSYYEQHRYTIDQRTDLTEENEDITTWTSIQFKTKITSLFLAALQQKEALQTISITKFNLLIKEGINSIIYRPTLFDVMAQDIIQYFSQEKQVEFRTKNTFRINNSAYLSNASEFMNLEIPDFREGDAIVLNIYQNLLKFHQQHKNIEAFVDADIQRIAFVNEKGNFDNKQQLNKQALTYLVNNYNNTKAISLAQYKIIEAKYPEGKNTDYQQKVTELLRLIQKYPNSGGANSAQTALTQLQEQQLNSEIEEVNLPNEAFRMLLTYKNIDRVKVEIISIPYDFTQEYSIEKLYKNIKGKKIIQTIQQQLPQGLDYRNHSAELKIDPLPSGNYLIRIQDENGKLVAYNRFQISTISFFIDQQDQVGYVLNRKNGEGLSNAKVISIMNKFNAKTKQYEYVLQDAYVTKNHGSFNFNLKINNHSTKSLIVYGNDTLVSNNTFSGYYRDGKATNDKYISFFTDRKIYRPGQIVHFKGILVEKEQTGQLQKVNVIAGTQVQIELKDANYQNVDKLNLTTNDFGSFYGSFTIPESGVNGNYQLVTSYGSISFNVEEYKRPKFYVEIPVPKNSIGWNQNLTLEGNAQAYSGIAIDNATVNYTVKRTIFYPFIWRCYSFGYGFFPPVNNQDIIQNGTVQTDQYGKFQIEMKTLTDVNVDTNLAPFYTYIITAEVTDLDGETRSATTNIVAAKQGFTLKSDVQNEYLSNHLSNIQITAKNPNGIEVSAEVNLNIYALQSPGYLRNRIWNAPDQFLYDEKTFKSYFPIDAYKEEGNPFNFKVKSKLISSRYNTTSNNKVDLSKLNLNDGGYFLLEWIAKDAAGNEIVQKEITRIVNIDKSIIEDVPFKVFKNKSSFTPGDTLMLYTLGKSSLDKIIFKNQSNTPLTRIINKKIQETDRGGLSYFWHTVYENRVYQNAEILEVPFSNKALTLELTTNRKKYEPGASEQWKMIVKDYEGKIADAELVASMYDASLNMFIENKWDLPQYFYNNYPYYALNTADFYRNYGQVIQPQSTLNTYFNIQYPYFELPFPEYYSRNYNTRTLMRSPAMMKAGNFADAAVLKEESANYEDAQSAPSSAEAENKKQEVQMRSDFNEMAFFIPQITKNAAQQYEFDFTLPGSLTTWNFQAFAHTRSFATGYLSQDIIAQKDLMINANIPRFFRQGDEMTLIAKVSNLKEEFIKSKVSIKFIDAQTGQELPFSLFQKLGMSTDQIQEISINARENVAVSWRINIPESIYQPVIVRFVAQSDNHTDGEEHLIPVMSNRVFLTESFPFQIKTGQEKSFTIDKLKQKNSNITSIGLTTEFTSNPAWYVVQALPYLNEPTYPSADALFHQFYVNQIASFIVNNNSVIENVISKWRENDTDALISNLSKNQGLKLDKIEDTPWLRDAVNETEQKRQITQLFNRKNIAKELLQTLSKLEKMQMASGGFPWFGGMTENRYTTQYIMTGLGRLRMNKVTENSKKLSLITTKGVAYLDRETLKNYTNSYNDGSKIVFDDYNLNYLYMRSYFTDVKMDAQVTKMYQEYSKALKSNWKNLNSYGKAMAILVLDRQGDHNTAKIILQSMQETAISNEEMGTYWKDIEKNGSSWYQGNIEAQSLIIEAYYQMKMNEVEVAPLKLWLLKQKQTTMWKTNRATADACFAFLLNDASVLSQNNAVEITLGNESLIRFDDKAELATGYIKKEIQGTAILPEMAEVKIQYKGNEKGQIGWGSMYYQYFDDMDKVVANDNSLKIERRYFKQVTADNQTELVDITNHNAGLSLGDKIVVRMIIRTDRNMEFVQVKDLRPAGLEPLDVLSRFQYKNGLGYYQETKDLSTNFFIDYLPKGNYVFEYTLYVNQKGNYSLGVAQIQNMYAPEFGSYSEGGRMIVE